MPIPPPPPMAFAAVAAAAKIAVKEYLPALSSASLAAWLLQWLWQRVPDWIKEDVVWHKKSSSSSSSSRTRTTTRTKSNNSKDKCESQPLPQQQQERLSTLWERHRALLAVAESLTGRPVPHLAASVLTFLQASSQLRNQPACVQRRNQVYQQAGPLLENSPTTSTVARNEEKQPTPSPLPDENVTDANNDESLERALDWAVWAYYIHDQADLVERLQTHGLTLERCVQADRPGSVGYYVALKDDLMVIAIKGTSSLEDILTDTCGRPVSYQPDHGYEDSHVVTEEPIEVRGRVDDQVIIPAAATTGETLITQSFEYHHTHDESCHSHVSVEVVSGHERVLFAGGDTTTILYNEEHSTHGHQERQIRCHEGILLSALAVAREVQGYVQKHIVAPASSSDKTMPPRRLRLVGHSLGASVACFVAMILRGRFPDVLASVSTTTHTHNQHHATPTAARHSMLHVYAFAPPPVVDHDSALACASYVTSIVNNADMIPRCSLVNLALWLEVLRSVSQRLVEADLAPATTPKRLAKFVQYIYGSGNEGDAVSKDVPPLLTVDQIWTSIETAREEFPLRHPDHCECYWRCCCL